MGSSFDRRFDDLSEGCPVCREYPTAVIALGPADIRLDPCGHTFSV